MNSLLLRLTRAAGSGVASMPPLPLAEKVTFFARAGLETMATIYNAVVFGGIGVFSKNIKYHVD